MPLSALLLSDDTEVMDVLRLVLPELGIHTDQCSSSRTARKLLKSQKYEAVIVDADAIGSLGFLSSLRQMPMTKNAIIFAIIHAISVKIAFQAGANFVLEKPMNYEKAMRSFHAAQGMILRERRRYYRHPVNMFATLEFGSRTEPVAVTNLSEGGMAIEAGSSIEMGMTVKWKFELPERRGLLSGDGEVSWVNNGKAGIRFTFVPHVYKDVLDEWLAERSQEEPTSAILAEDHGWNSED